MQIAHGRLRRRCYDRRVFGKLLLLSIVITMIALPIMTAREANPRRALTKTVVLMLAFNVLYLVGIRFLLPRLL
jgi:hypothetical protein